MLGLAQTLPPRRADHRLAGRPGSPTNFYWHLEAMLDLSIVRQWTHELYADRGRSSIDPVAFFNLPLVMFFEWRGATLSREPAL
jgi:hypothetical protein